MDLQLSGARAIVTGGSGAIGRAVARGLAAEGARVALVARDPKRLLTVADELRRAGADGLCRTGSAAGGTQCG